MRRDRPRPSGRSLTRSWLLVGLALIAIVNIFYIWPIRLGSSRSRSAATPVVAHKRVHARKNLAVIKAAIGEELPRFAVHLNCGDQSPSCQQQRREGKCSTHLLDGFHTCLASCGVCPALELALRRSLNLTTDQLLVAREPGPPRCEDGASWCSQLGQAAGGAEGQAAACAGGPAQLAAACKATCGACLRPETVPGTAGPSDAAARPAAAAAAAAAAGDGCFDAADMCAWWAQRDPRVCHRAAEDLQSWWWVAVACRRSCGLCGDGTAHSSGNGNGTKGGVAAAAAAVAAAARLGVQVGEAPDGSPQVSVFQALTDGPGSCTDTQAQCATWAAGGECTRNRGFMSEACPAACNTCPVLVNQPQPLLKVRLNNGVLLPTVGYGCAGLGDSAQDTVRWALEAGYRHLDSAQAREWYREDLVGKALQAFLAAQAGSGGVRRENIFVTSKLHPRHLGYNTTLKQFNSTLRDLGSDYVDLFLLHYAECWGDLCGGVAPEGNFLDSWRALEKLYDAGLVRAIGVSNFAPDQLARLLAAARVRPAVLQVHVDPLGRNEELQAMCRREGLALTAYSTLGTQWGAGKNPVLSHPVLQTIGREAGAAAAAAAAADGAAGGGAGTGPGAGTGTGAGPGAGAGAGEGGAPRSAAQVALRWALQEGLVVLPRSSNQVRIRQNLQLYDWGLTADHMRQIAHLRRAT